MKIDSGTIGMESARTYQSVKTSYRRFVMKEYQGGVLNSNDFYHGNLSANGDQNKEHETSGTNAESADKKLFTLQDWQNSLAVRESRLNIRTTAADSTMSEFRQLTVRYIFQLLFGDRSDRINDWMEKYGLNCQSAGAQSVAQSGAQSGAPVTSGSEQLQDFMASQAVVRQYQFTEESYRYEQESTTFSTVGTVRTSDGREIRFNVEIGMSREFVQTFSQELDLSFTLRDPLVINLDTGVTKLSDQKFFFDIDADGVEDEISELGSGSGYLALDKNDDGTINDGSELFGTASGNGFADLAEYDEDGNGWIDENDEIWSKLKIWIRDENGRSLLYRLADKGVGAICLQNAATDFTLQGAGGATNGVIRSTGVFLYESGSVGTLQHVDVAKYEQGA